MTESQLDVALILGALGKNSEKTKEWKSLFQKLDPKASIQGRTCASRKLTKVWQQAKVLLTLPSVKM